MTTLLHSRTASSDPNCRAIELVCHLGPVWMTACVRWATRWPEPATELVRMKKEPYRL